MQIQETTFNLNLTVVGETYETAKIQIEGMNPMGKEEFWDWIIKASKRGELPKTSRPSREVWRDTKEHPQPKEVKEKMDEFAKQYKRFKRLFPQASDQILRAKTTEFLENKRKILADFSDILSKSLFGEDSNCTQTAQGPTNFDSTEFPKISIEKEIF